jgi:hypothetical protein
MELIPAHVRQMHRYGRQSATPVTCPEGVKAGRELLPVLYAPAFPILISAQSLQFFDELLFCLISVFHYPLPLKFRVHLYILRDVYFLLFEPN